MGPARAFPIEEVLALFVMKPIVNHGGDGLHVVFSGVLFNLFNKCLTPNGFVVWLIKFYENIVKF